VLNGFAAKLSTKELDAVRADPAVAYVQPDSIVKAETDQTSPPWGLDRIDQRLRPTNNVYSYDSTGAGVTVFVVDSGIRATHTDFGGRAQGVYDAVGDGNGTNDCNGHGTHVAGIAGSQTHGVAKAVQIRAVRVLGCDGTGFSSDTIEGMDFVAANHPTRSVVNISIGSSNPATSTAAEALIDSGVHVVISAGNNNVDACSHMPRTSRGFLVGASDSADTIAAFSNYGPCVDVFAPGEGILSTWHTSDTATQFVNGTSMAAPHVAGWIARYLEENPSAGIASTKAALIAQSTKGVLRGLDSTTPNRLLWADPADTPPDTTPPSVPGSPTLDIVDASSAQFSWTAATDNVGVTGYNVYRVASPTDVLVGYVFGTFVVVGGLNPGTSYGFYVRAHDASGNLSAASGTLNVTTSPSICRVMYQVGGGGNTFTANLTVTNTGTVPINGWVLEFDFTAGQQLIPGQSWGASWTQSASHVSATNMPWNQTIAVGSSVFPGFNATHTGTNPLPVQVMLNGQACSVV